MAVHGDRPAQSVDDGFGNVQTEAQAAIVTCLDHSFERIKYSGELSYLDPHPMIGDLQDRMVARPLGRDLDWFPITVFQRIGYQIR